MEKLFILDFLLFPGEQEAQSRAHSEPNSMAFFSAGGADARIVALVALRRKSLRPKFNAVALLY
jgi:hypothetical protein